MFVFESSHHNLLDELVRFVYLPDDFLSEEVLAVFLRPASIDVLVFDDVALARKNKHVCFTFALRSVLPFFCSTCC